MKKSGIYATDQALIIPVCLFSSCAGGRQEGIADCKGDLWSVKMADAVMTRADSLVHYDPDRDF